MSIKTSLYSYKPLTPASPKSSGALERNLAAAHRHAVDALDALATAMEYANRQESKSSILVASKRLEEAASVIGETRRKAISSARKKRSPPADAHATMRPHFQSEYEKTLAYIAKHERAKKAAASAGEFKIKSANLKGNFGRGGTPSKSPYQKSLLRRTAGGSGGGRNSSSKKKKPRLVTANK